MISAAFTCVCLFPGLLPSPDLGQSFALISSSTLRSSLKQTRSRWRKIKAAWRDTSLLLRQFRQPLLFFILMMIGFGWLFYVFSLATDHPVDTWLEGIYDILTMTFLNPVVPFPGELSLQAFYFLMPVLGIGILAQGLAEFGVMFFNRRSRGKEWEMAVASTFTNHIVLIGLGHLGYRVVKTLREMEEDVVVITLAPDPNLVISAHSMDVPVIEGDGTREAVLESANIRRARSILLCTQNDSLNLQMALKARSMNPDLDVVIRIFDDDFAMALQHQFGFRALSATGMAAPIFASSAANIDITPPITIEGQPNCLARIHINDRSSLINKSLGALEDQFNLSIVFLSHDGISDTHPSAHLSVSAGDTIAILGDPQAINSLVHENK
jgi:voltage-gated potassium channel